MPGYVNINFGGDNARFPVDETPFPGTLTGHCLSCNILNLSRDSERFPRPPQTFGGLQGSLIPVIDRPPKQNGCFWPDITFINYFIDIKDLGRL